MSITVTLLILLLQRREDDVQQHDSLRDTVPDASEDQISSPHEYDEYSERKDSLVSLFRAQMSPELMQKYVERYSTPSRCTEKESTHRNIFRISRHRKKHRTNRLEGIHIFGTLRSGNWESEFMIPVSEF